MSTDGKPGGTPLPITLEWVRRPLESPTAVQYEQLDQAFEEEGLPAVWTMSGPRGLGSAIVRDGSLQAVLRHRGEMTGPAHLSVEAGDHSGVVRDQDALVVFIEDTASERTSRAAIFAKGHATQPQFDRLVRKLETILAPRPRPATWVQENTVKWRRIRGFIEWVQLGLMMVAFVSIFSIIMVVAGGEDSDVDGATRKWVVIFAILSSAGAYGVRSAIRRGSALAEWAPPEIDRWSLDGLRPPGSDPPPFVQRDLLLTAVGILGSTVAGVIVVLIL